MASPPAIDSDLPLEADLSSEAARKRVNFPTRRSGTLEWKSAPCSLRRLRASDCVAQRPVATPEAHDSAFGDDRIHGYVMGLRINCLKTPDFITDANGQRLLGEGCQRAPAGAEVAHR
jgi:hypothetical protein